MPIDNAVGVVVCVCVCVSWQRAAATALLVHDDGFRAPFSPVLLTPLTYRCVLSTCSQGRKKHGVRNSSISDGSRRKSTPAQFLLRQAQCLRAREDVGRA